MKYLANILILVVLFAAACNNSNSVLSPTPKPIRPISTPIPAWTVTALQPSPTVTPSACLDETAKPRLLPSRQTPLEVQFISDGNIWTWNEEIGSAHQVTNTGDTRSFYFSPDGKAIAFTRGAVYGQTELWSIQRNGTNLKLLVSADQLHNLVGEPSTTDHPYVDEIGYIDWIEGTHTFGFEILRNYDAIGGCCESGGYWQVDVNTGELAAWTPPPESVNVGESKLSPNGEQMAIITDSTISLRNADGTNLRENIFAFETSPVHEGGGTIYPRIEWAKDSQSLLAITFKGDIYSDETTSTTWRIPLDGSPAQELHTFPAPHYWMFLSSNQKHLVYQKRVQPRTNTYELHLAFFDGSQDVMYATQSLLEFLHWHPNSYHFVYHQWNIFRPFLGSVCGDPLPLLNPSDTPATQIQWIDASRFLYVKGPLDPMKGTRELRLGQLSGPSILIGEFRGETAYYIFNVEKAALGLE